MAKAFSGVFCDLIRGTTIDPMAVLLRIGDSCARVRLHFRVRPVLAPGPHKLLKTAGDLGRAAGNPLPLPRELAKQSLPSYTVEPGDVLLLEPADMSTAIRLPGDQTVQPDGTIGLGIYGSLSVAGKTIEQIQSEAQDLIDSHAESVAKASSRSADEQDEEPAKVNVRLVEPTSKVYYVIGEVNSPGAYPLIGRETVLDAIIEAGDLTDSANRHTIILSRPTLTEECRIVLPICYRQIVQLGDTSTNYQIQAGDRIFVSSLTCGDRFVQTLLPARLETCPRCSSPQLPCPHLMAGEDCGICYPGEPTRQPWPRRSVPLRASLGWSGLGDQAGQSPLSGIGR